MPTGRRVVTPGPSTRTRTGPGARAPPGGPPATVTRTTWHGPRPVLTNKGVDSACTIRMTSSSHAAGRSPPRAPAEGMPAVPRRAWAARIMMPMPSAPAGTRVTRAGSR